MTRPIESDSFGEFAREFADIVPEAADELLVETHKGMHRHVAKEVVNRTPVEEGHMRDAWKHLGPGQSRATESVEAALSALDKPGETHIVNNDPGAIVVLGKGRSKLKTGRMGGSPKAPRGVVKPTLDALPTKAGGIFDVTSRKVSSRSRRRRRRR